MYSITYVIYIQFFPCNMYLGYLDATRNAPCYRDGRLPCLLREALVYPSGADPPAMNPDLLFSRPASNRTCEAPFDKPRFV